MLAFIAWANFNELKTGKGKERVFKYHDKTFGLTCIGYPVILSYISLKTMWVPIKKTFNSIELKVFNKHFSTMLSYHHTFYLNI